MAQKYDKNPHYHLAIGRIYDNGDFEKADTMPESKENGMLQFCIRKDAIDPLADTEFSPLYTIGSEEFVNDTLALKHYKIAIELGSIESSYRLAKMTMKGQGTPKNLDTALTLILKAATSDYVEAQLWAGLLYGGYDGTTFFVDLALKGGMSPNFVVSYMWMNIAASKGNAPAAQWRKALERKMTAQEVAKAQKYSSNCVGSNFKNCADGTMADYFR